MNLLLAFIGAPYKIRTCDPRFRKPMLYPTELRAQLIYSRYLSQNMSICFLNSIYISRNLSVKRQMSDRNKSVITICNSYDSLFHVKYLVAIDSESHRLWFMKRSSASRTRAASQKESLSMLIKVWTFHWVEFRLLQKGSHCFLLKSLIETVIAAKNILKI